MKNGVFAGEEKLQEEWLKSIQPVLDVAEIKLPPKKVEAVFGGRQGFHTEYLKPLLEEMTEVYRFEPGAEW